MLFIPNAVHFSPKARFSSQTQCVLVEKHAFHPRRNAFLSKRVLFIPNVAHFSPKEFFSSQTQCILVQKHAFHAKRSAFWSKSVLFMPNAMRLCSNQLIFHRPSLL